MSLLLLFSNAATAAPVTPPHGANNATPTLYPAPRRLTPFYEVYLTDITTRRIAVVRRFESLTYSRVLNGVGEFELTLASDFDTSLLREGGLVEVHRAYDGASSPKLDFIGFILGEPEYFTANNNYFVKVKGPDLNHMLTWREQVGYTIVAEVNGAVDNNMRFFVDQNLGLAAATGRSLVNDYSFSVEPNRSWANNMYVQVDRRPLLDYLGGLAKQSAENSTKRVKLFYGVVPTGLNPLKVQFQVRPYLWGVDRTATGSLPVVLRPGRGLRNVVIERDATDEKTAIYVEYNNGTIASPITNDARLYTSPAGRREGYLNVNDTGDASVAADAARVALRDQRRIYRVRGEVEQVRGAALGDYALGDHISLAARGILSTVRVDSYSVTVANGGDGVAVKYEYVE